jgi:ABC-type Fe3+/spermidine/putrescine transport system ATPase subunit
MLNGFEAATHGEILLAGQNINMATGEVVDATPVNVRKRARKH